MRVDIWQAVVLGLVEGVTEFLPVSSTGHLIIAQEAMRLDRPETKSAVESLLIVMQGGAILAVAGVFWPRMMQMLRGLMGRDNAGFMLLVNLCLAFIPAAILGVLFHSKIKEYLFGPVPVIIAIGVGGIYMLIVDQWLKGRFGVNNLRTHGRTVTDLTPLDAVFIGVMQCIAMWPGTSRSMMTITGGTFAGLRPRDAAEFAFLLGIPTLGGATALELFKNIRSDQPMTTTLGWPVILVALVVATVSAFVAVKWLVGFLNRHGLALFGWYRLALAAILIVLLAKGVLTTPSEPPTAKPTTTANAVSVR